MNDLFNEHQRHQVIDQVKKDLEDTRQLLNRVGDRRGLYKRTAKTLAKIRTKSLNRATAQYKRACDTKVGRYLRGIDEKAYNTLLESADAATERQKQ